MTFERSERLSRHRHHRSNAFLISDGRALAIFGGIQATTLSITEGNSVSSSFAMVPIPDQIHVLKSCDIGGTTFETGVCVPLVTHVDGTIVLLDTGSPGQAPLTHTAATAGDPLVETREIDFETVQKAQGEGSGVS